MTTTYPSKEMAIEMGIYYATGQSEKANTDMLKVKGMIEQFGIRVEKSELYELTNSKGTKATFGISPTKDGYHLWLISPNGVALRT